MDLHLPSWDIFRIRKSLKFQPQKVQSGAILPASLPDWGPPSILHSSLRFRASEPLFLCDACCRLNAEFTVSLASAVPILPLPYLMDGVFYLPADSPSPSSSTRPRNSHPSPVTAISRDLSQTHLSRTQVLPRSDSFVLHQPRLRGESGPTLGSFQSSRQSTFPYSKPRPLPKDPPYRFSSWDGPRPSSQTLKRTLAESRSEMLSEIPVETSLYQAEALPCHLSSAGNGYTITHETVHLWISLFPFHSVIACEVVAR